MSQDMVGQARKEFLEAFKKLIGQKAAKQFDEAIDFLRGITDPDRFRTQTYLVLTDAFQFGAGMAIFLTGQRID